MKCMKTFSKFGEVTIDPVSTLDEFQRFWTKKSSGNVQPKFTNPFFSILPKML